MDGLLADRVTVPVGRYDLRRLTAFTSSSPSRPVGFSVMGSLADEWDGRVSSVETAIKVAGGSHLEAGSDIYVVFNDDQGEEDEPDRLVSRGFAVKGTWLIRF